MRWLAVLALALAACGAAAHPDTPAARGDSPLMLAALTGSAADVDQLLARGADPRHANAAGATALHWAVDDLDKTRALLAAGADPNAEDRDGVTPLVTAALRDDGAPVVELLLAHGADAAGSRDGPQPIVLAGGGDPAIVEMLLAHGARARAHTAGGWTALHSAAVAGNAATARLLVDHGADLEARDRFGRTPLMFAAQMGFAEVVALLLARGAAPDRRETFSQTTALMQAASSDRAEVGVVGALLAAGADASLRDDEDASALTWAQRRGDPRVVAAIVARDATHRPSPISRAEGTPVGAANTPAAAIARAIPLLERGRVSFRAATGCPSCHHDALPALALARAAEAGFPIDAAARATETRATLAALRPGRDSYVDGLGFSDIVEPAYLLVGLDASGAPRDDVTAAAARYLALRQRRDGGWRTMMQRIPVDGSDVTLTALAIRALAVYARGPDTAARIARARDYLAHADARTTEDLAYKALGLRWAGAPAADVAPALAALAATQRGDGGFAQRAGLPSDAYATGQAIVALHDAGDASGADPGIARAVRFLVAAQLADGSWFVATRALRFQPFVDSGSPQGRSQYMSAAATAWATLALAAVADDRKPAIVLGPLTLEPYVKP